MTSLLNLRLTEKDEVVSQLTSKDTDGEDSQQESLENYQVSSHYNFINI